MRHTGKLAITVLLLAALCVVLLSVPACAESSGSLAGGLRWKLDGKGTLTVSGKGEMPDFNYRNPAP